MARSPKHDIKAARFVGQALALIGVLLVAVGCSSTGSALHQAAAAGNTDKVAALVKKGGNVNQPDKSRGTPLIAAIRAGRESVAGYLIEHGADVNAKVPSTPLYFAAAKGQTTMVKLLLEKGANPDLQDSDGETALHGAVRGGVSVVEMLIQARANVNAVNRAGYTPLNLAAKHAANLCPTETARLLLDAGALTNTVPKDPAVTGKTLGLYAGYLKERGRTNEAVAAYAAAKGYLEQGVQVAAKRRSAASRKSFWASVFEPMPQTPGSTYRQGAISQSLTSALGTAIFAGHSSSDYTAQKAAAGNEVSHLKSIVEECTANAGPSR